MSKCQNIGDEFRCPGKWELFYQLLALLPRGRAWQSHVQDPMVEKRNLARIGQARIGRHHLGGTQPEPELATTMRRYWASFAEILAHFHARACALTDEFFCFSANETLDHWYKDYAFPDACDPYEKLCEKVAAQGGSTCAYLREVAAKRGWEIECVDCSAGFGAQAGCAQAGCAIACGCAHNTLWIRIITENSPAFNDDFMPRMAGCAQIGDRTSCGPDIQQIQCLIERVKPAHVLAIYEVIYP